MIDDQGLQDHCVAGDSVPPSASGPADAPTRETVALRRDDLATCLAGYRKASAGQGLPVYALGFSGLMASIGLLEIGLHAAWPAVLAVPVFLAGVGAVVGAWRLAVRRDLALRQRYQLTCPACGRDLLAGADRWTDRATTADRTLATGRCPHCHVEILAG